jgi:hypothetical protein
MEPETPEFFEEERIERLSFHLQTGDYFPMLATILGFVEESVQDCSCTAVDALAPLERDVLKGTRHDLMYLHKNYRIVPISEVESETT